MTRSSIQKILREPATRQCIEANLNAARVDWSNKPLENIIAHIHTLIDKIAQQAFNDGQVLVRLQCVRADAESRFKISNELLDAEIQEIKKKYQKTI